MPETHWVPVDGLGHRLSGRDLQSAPEPAFIESDGSAYSRTAASLNRRILDRERATSRRAMLPRAFTPRSIVSAGSPAKNRT